MLIIKLQFSYLQQNKIFFEELGITLKKPFYDILIKVTDKYDFSHKNAKCLVLATESKMLVDDKASICCKLVY